MWFAAIHFVFSGWSYIPARPQRDVKRIKSNHIESVSDFKNTSLIPFTNWVHNAHSLAVNRMRIMYPGRIMCILSSLNSQRMRIIRLCDQSVKGISHCMEEQYED